MAEFSGDIQLSTLMLKGIAEIESITKDQVQARLQDWKERLERLMNTITEWSRQYAPDYEVTRYLTRQINESLMMKFEIAPDQVPALSLRKENQRIAFVPSSLWIIGANGRVNVTANETYYSLLDVGGESGQPGDWKIVSKDVKKELVPFNPDVFQNIIRNQPV